MELTKWIIIRALPRPFRLYALWPITCQPPYWFGWQVVTPAGLFGFSVTLN
jgi:hypothetical protein